ncbi:MAG TPA: hypothetical protein VJ203_14255 [Bacteroidales bacterium]|nr:hypothetical protein [Bacteroidales bacterium]
MTNYEIWSLIINAAMAIGVIGIALLAVFGDGFRKIIFPARLEVEILDKNGELTILDSGHRVIYYHLRFINRKSVVVRNCRVYLKKIQKRQADGKFQDMPMSVPPRYVWTPSETSPEGVDIVTEQVVDFGYIIDNSREFKPTVTPIYNSFKGNLGQNESFIYYIEIVADNYRSRQLIGIEVSWDGKWPENLKDMHRSLVIKRV